MLQRAQSHENIIAIHSAYRGECHCYIVMELATGGTKLCQFHTKIGPGNCNKEISMSELQ